MLDMMETIIGQTQTIFDTVSSEKSLSLCAIIISILSLSISFYNTVVLNKSSIAVRLYSKYILDESSLNAHLEAEVSITNKSRRTKYINYIALTYSPLPKQRHYIISQEIIKIEPEEETKVPISLERGYLQEEYKPVAVKAIIRDTRGKRWKSKEKLTYSELQMISEQRRVYYMG